MSDPATCPICAGSHLDVVGSHRASSQSYSLVHCRGCGLQHWQPLAAPAAAYYEDEQQAMYTALHAGRSTAHDDPRFSRFLQDVGGSTRLRLLDVGCSDGVLIDAFAAGGNEVVGIDIDRRSLEAARRRGLEVHEATLEQFKEKLAGDRRFDVVTMFDVLEHLTEPRRTLELVRSLLVPGGRLFGTVPNRHRLFANQIRADFPPHHFLRFDRDFIDRAMREVGLIPRQVDVFQWGYAGPVLLDTTIKAAKRLMRGRRKGAGPRASDATSTGTDRASVKHRIARELTRSLSRVTGPIERALDRGFKLYFVAHRPHH